MAIWVHELELSLEMCFEKVQLLLLLHEFHYSGVYLGIKMEQKSTYISLTVPCIFFRPAYLAFHWIGHVNSPPPPKCKRREKLNTFHYKNPVFQRPNFNSVSNKN